MRVSDYEYDVDAEGIVSQKRGEELIEAVEMKIRKNSIPHFEILKIGKNDEEDEFIYKYLAEKGIEIKGTNITMEEIDGYKEVAKKGVNYNNLPEVIDPDLQQQLFEKMGQIKAECLENGTDYLEDKRYQDAKKIIWDGNLRLARYIASFKTFKIVNKSEEELASYGYEAIYDAIDKFDYTRGNKFSTYAWVAIYRRIERGIANEYGINQNQYLEYKELQETRQMFFKEIGREPNEEELKGILGFNENKIKNFLRFDEVVVNTDSVEERVYEEDTENIATDEHSDSGKVVKIGDDYYEDGLLVEGKTKDDAIDWENNAGEKARINEIKKFVEQVLETLTPREAEVLRLRFGLKDGSIKTLEEVGKEFNVNRERIRQIEAKAFRKMRHPSRSILLRGLEVDIK